MQRICTAREEKSAPDGGVQIFLPGLTNEPCGFIRRRRPYLPPCSLLNKSPFSANAEKGVIYMDKTNKHKSFPDPYNFKQTGEFIGEYLRKPKEKAEKLKKKSEKEE